MTEDIDALEPGPKTDAKVWDALHPDKPMTDMCRCHMTLRGWVPDARECCPLRPVRWEGSEHNARVVWIAYEYSTDWGVAMQAAAGMGLFCRWQWRPESDLSGSYWTIRLRSDPHGTYVSGRTGPLAVCKAILLEAQITNGTAVVPNGMTVIEIVKFMMDDNMRESVFDLVAEYLEGWEFDGLYSDECCCLASDLAPCGEMKHDCRAGVKVPCDHKPGDEHSRCEEGCEWHIVPRSDKSKATKGQDDGTT